MKCDCTVRCDSQCLNRNSFIECSSSVCIFGKSCENIQIQKKKTARIQLFKTQKKGNGIKTKDFIKKGSYIAEYVGVVRKQEEFLELVRTEYAHDKNHYCMSYERGMVIDAYRFGNIVRYINHSCDPNCQIQKWIVNGVTRMALYATKNINKNIELTYDYKFSSFNAQSVQKCYCNSSNCRGSI